MKTKPDIAGRCFAACTHGSRLLVFLSEAARRATAGGLFWEFNFSAGGHFRDDFTPLMSQNILKAGKFFEGKFPGATIKPKNNRLEERTHPRQTHE